MEENTHKKMVDYFSSNQKQENTSYFPLSSSYKALDDSEAHRQAQLATLAGMKDVPEDYAEAYASTYRANLLKMKAGQSSIIENQTRAARLRDGASMAALLAPVGDTSQSSQMMQQFLAQRAQEDQPLAIEASEVMMDLMETATPEERELYQRAASTPTFIEGRLRADARQALLAKVVAEEIDQGDRNVFFHLVDFAMSAIPFYDSLDSQGIVKADDVTKRWYDGIFAGERRVSQISNFWAMSDEEFTEDFVRETVRNLKKSSTLLGYKSRLRELDLLSQLQMGTSAEYINMFNALDNVPIMASTALKGGRVVTSLPKLLRYSGSREASVNTINKLLKIVQEEGPEGLRRATGETLEALEDEALPGAINPADVGEVGRVGAEAGRRFELGERLFAELEINPTLLSRLTPEETQMVIDAARKKIEREIGQKRVLDVRTETRTDVSGIESRVMIVEVGTSKGGRWANRSTAERFLRSEGFDVAHVNYKGGPLPKGEKPYKNLPASKDPTITKIENNAIAVGLADEYVINPSPERIAAEAGQSQFQEAKLLVTKDGNRILIPDGLNHGEAVDELLLSFDEVGYSTYRLGKGEGKAVSNDGAEWLTREQTPVTTSKETKVALEEIGKKRGRIELLTKELDDLKRSLSFRDELFKIPPARLIAVQKQIREQINAVTKEIQKLSDEVKDLKATKDIPAQATLKESEDGFGVVAEVEVPLEEMGHYTKIKDQKTLTGWGKIVLGGRQLQADDLYGFSVRSDSRSQRIMAVINKSIVPVFKKLKPRERQALDEVITLSDEQGRWLSKNEVDALYAQKGLGVVPPKEFHDAYTMFKAVNDIEYMLRNSEAYSIKNAQGYSTVAVKTNHLDFSDMNGKVSREIPDDIPAGRVYNASDDIMYTKNNAHLWNKQTLQDEGFALIQLDRAVVKETPVGPVHVDKIIVRKGELAQSPLSKTQINYRAGGHRIYSPKVKYFVKQATVLRQADTGEEYLGAAKTWIGGLTRADLQDWVVRHNHGLVIMRSVEDGTTSLDDARRALKDIVDDPDSFINDIDDGIIDTRNPFEIVGDRELPSLYGKSNRPPSLGGDEVMPGNLSAVETQGRMYYSPKGKPLTDATGQALPRLDAYETLNRSLGNVAQLTGFSSFKERAINKWVATYGPYLDTTGRASVGRNFLESTFRQGTDKKIISAAEQQRDAIRRVLNWRTPGDIRAQQRTRQMIESLEDSRFLGTNQLARLLNWAEDTDFITKARGLVFDAKLTFLNVGQLFLQSQTIVMAKAIDPVNSHKAIRAMPWFRAYLAGKYADPVSFRNFLESKGWTLGFDSVDEAMMVADEMRTGGFFDIGGSHVQVNDLNQASAFNLAGSVVGDAREKMRFFFFEAEKWNRTVAFQTAWRQVKKSNPNLALRSAEFLDEVYKRADDLSLNMTKSGAAMWQKGLMSLPTQFFPYAQHFIEGLFGKQFTNAQKARLITSQFLAYGTTGVPLVALASELYKGKTGSTPDFEQNPLLWTLDRGLFDFMAKMGGFDIAISERVGLGHAHTDIIRGIFGASRYGEETAFDQLTGATGTILVDVGADMAKVIKYAWAESGQGKPLGPLTREALTDLARNISTVNSSLKAYAVWKTGVLESMDGKALAEVDGSAQNVIATFLGIPLEVQTEVSPQITWLRHRGESIDDLAKVIAGYRSKFAAEYPNSEGYEEQLTMLSKIYDDIWLEALDRADMYTLSPTYDSIARKVQEKQALDKAKEEND